MPITATGTLASIQQDILDALQGRTDVSTAQLNYYAARTIRELSESYPFDELRTTGPNFALTNQVSVYAISNFLNANDDYSMPESFSIFIDIGTNTVINTIKYKTPAAIEPMLTLATQGIPAWYTRFGSNFHLGPTPNGAYTTFLRYQVKHPFSSPPASADPLYLPFSWYDIAAYGTAERIAIIKRWNDQATFLHQILYGDPEYQASQGKRGRPGLIAARVFQQERDEAYNSRQVMPLVGRYNSR